MRGSSYAPEAWRPMWTRLARLVRVVMDRSLAKRPGRPPASPPPSPGVHTYSLFWMSMSTMSMHRGVWYCSNSSSRVAG
eukprot:5817345-Prymnesium_polylepis.4